MSALVVENLRFDYGSKVALRDVSFSIEPGQFCALLGPNGAGKSTLFSLLTRLRVAKAGRIEVSGQDIARRPLAAMSRIGVVFQQPTLDLDLNVWRNLIYFAGLHGLRGTGARARIEAVLDQLSMAERAFEKVRDLNGGHRRRMEIARALIHRPDILLLDEPTVGLDAQSRHTITRDLHAMARDGISVLWATHLVDEISDNDRVLVFHDGQIRADGTGRALRNGRPLLESFLDMTSTLEATS